MLDILSTNMLLTWAMTCCFCIVQAEKLLCAVHDAKSHAQRQLESVTGRRRLPTTHSAPSHQVASPPSTPGGNQGWMSSAWNWLTDEAGGSSVVRSTPAATLDAWKRIEQLLQAIEDNLCIIFQVCILKCSEM